MSIHDYVIKNLESDSKKDIIEMLDESVNDDDEALLPGMGVLLGILWSNINNDEKNNIATKLVDSIKKEKTAN